MATKDIDLSEFEVTQARPCTVATLALNDLQREKLEAALARPKISAWKITKVVRGWGFSMSDDSIIKHRAGMCDCGPPGES
jgi:hypothetical protein